MVKKPFSNNLRGDFKCQSCPISGSLRPWDLLALWLVPRWTRPLQHYWKRMRDSSSPQVPRGCHSGGFRAVPVPGRGIQDLRPSEHEVQRRGQKTNSSAFVFCSLRRAPTLQGTHGHCPGSAGLRGTGSSGCPDPSAGAARASRSRSDVQLSGSSPRKVRSPPLPGTGWLRPVPSAPSLPRAVSWGLSCPGGANAR